MTYCHSSWEFLNELKWGLFIPVLYSLTIWLASLFKCIAGDRANGESSASQQQVSIFKKNTKTPNKNPNQTTPKTQKKWTKRTRKFPSVAFSHSCNIPMKRRSLTILLYMYWARFYSLNSNICFFIRNGPIFLVSQRKKPGVFFTASTWVPTKVYEVLTGRDISSTEGHQKIRR